LQGTAEPRDIQMANMTTAAKRRARATAAAATYAAFAGIMLCS